MASNSILTAAVILGILVVICTGLILVYMPETPEMPKCPACSVSCPEPTVVVKTVNQTVEVPTDFKQSVVDALLSEVETDKSYRTCGSIRYNSDEVTVKKVYDGFTVTENTDGELTVSNVKVKLSYDNGKCYRLFTCGLDTDKQLTCE